MSLLQQSRKMITAVVLILVLTITTACGGNVAQVDRTTNPPVVGRDVAYTQLERGNTASGQSFGNWVVQTSRGLVKDAYVRDNNKLGVVISPQVRPNEVRSLARSLVEGFRKNFPSQDLTVLVYAPDKQLILTAKYDTQTNQVQYS
ncbi:MAG: hypothetical protein KME28_02180 [Pelatocladus maniniholoensis HA4357-MV3]|uniref:Uncharacterized protein n=1 Tax=Pelatocladus maniniholoensis HA4357-MV3 TaxID=1117104 RepID=A0A9E3H4G1_9NOST|nr:hypothetical protein [Pelatocladus maniniholoensis HA4357-MV3]BAZ70427.1 hypothetical protein NIES4106_52210 [Fischerella sp. NIES-4106]